jgi:hypothetical protein
MRLEAKICHLRVVVIHLTIVKVVLKTFPTFEAGSDVYCWTVGYSSIIRHWNESWDFITQEAHNNEKENIFDGSNA